ncbi:MAG: TauD/TfdA family dioxygenase [Novosphingobium sp.]
MATRFQDPDQPFKVVRYTGVGGATVSGIDLGQPVLPETKDALLQALVEYKLLIFRDQNITARQQLDFGRSLGPLEVHPFTFRSKSGEEKTGFYNDNELPEVVVLESKKGARFAAEQWHSDVTFRQDPSLASILRCVVPTSFGGDTFWADMEAAYDGLEPEFKKRLEELTAIHDWHQYRDHFCEIGVDEKEISRLRDQFPEAEHPVVRTHPVSGRKCIFVNPVFTVRIKSLGGEESSELLCQLFRLAYKPDYQIRLRWAKNTVAIWDNRSTQHYVAPDFGDQHRRMERVTLAGDRPF